MSARVLLGVAQFFFTVSWTVYVIFLPRLAERVGLGSHVAFLLMCDQVLFVLVDSWVGMRSDEALSVFKRFARPLAVTVVVSSAAFALIPIAAGRSSQVFFVIAIAVWIVASAGLRVPPLALLARYAGPRGATLGAASYAAGLGIAGAIAPYLTLVLRERDAKLPFLLASASVAIAAVGLVRALTTVPDAATADDPAAASGKVAPPRATAMRVAVALLIAAALGGLAAQVHFSLRSPALFTRLEGARALPRLMPVFWAGFSIAMFPATRLLATRSATAVLTGALLIFAVAAAAMELAPALPIAIFAQTMAGAAWGAAFLASLGGCAALGHTGREGRLLGRLFAIWAAATFFRMAVAAAGVGSARFVPWLPTAACVVAFLLLWRTRRVLTAKA